MPKVNPYETPWSGGEKNNFLQRRKRIYVCNLFMLKINDKTPQLREEKKKGSMLSSNREYVFVKHHLISVLGFTLPITADL
jgi:hypothetical protein